MSAQSESFDSPVFDPTGPGHMKPKHHKHNSRHSYSLTSKNAKVIDLESLASQLDQLATAKLPDGCLDGVMRGQEPEIRQDAILLALRWFGKCANKDEWIPAVSIAHALRFIKLRYARRLSKRPEHLQIDDEVIPVTMALTDSHICPMSGRPHAAQMAIQAIHQATKSGVISTANAAIILMALEDEQPISTIARRLKLTTGAVYYHINQVRAVLPAIVAKIEEPRFCSKSTMRRV